MNLNGKRAVVTGGCGFIGSHIAERLTGTENEVVIIDNLASGYEDNIKNMAGKIQYHNASILDDLSEYMAGANVIFHLAANVSVTESVEKPIFDAEINVKGTLNLLETARKLDIPQVVYSSSSAVYGDDVKIPTDEDQPVTPSSPYGINKYVGELYFKLYAELYGIHSISLRYFNVYGPRQPADSPYSGVIAIFINNAIEGKPLTIYGDGEQSRDFVAVQDVVNANISAAEKEGMNGEAVNIGTGKDTTLNQLVEVIESFSGKLERIYDEPRKGDIKRSTADIKRAGELLSFTPEITLKQGLKELYDLTKNKTV